jgi:hypothetical protein
LAQNVDGSRRAAHTYILCGWHIRSDIPLTGVLKSVPAREKVDIAIQIGPGCSPLVKRGGRFVFEHSADCSRIGIQDVADFEVSDGEHIRVWPAAAATQKDIEIFLFGPAWATLCHQRGLLPLHASAVATGAGITAFAGHSGAGKSTIAALLGSLGYELVADDILIINFDEDLVPGGWPYLRRLKLQADSISHLALTPTELVSETIGRQKYFVHPKYASANKWSSLQRLYLLVPDQTVSHISIDRISGAEAVRALIDQTYHFSYILGSGRFRDHLAFCAMLASKIAVYRLRRPLSFSADELGSLVCAHLEGPTRS